MNKYMYYQLCRNAKRAREVRKNKCWLKRLVAFMVNPHIFNFKSFGVAVWRNKRND